MKNKYPHNRKLTEDQVRAIWKDIHKGKKSMRVLAEEYGVNPSTIYDIRKGKTWLDLYLEFNGWQKKRARFS